MTEQEVFDKVVAHLLQQQAYCESENSEPLYRGVNGTKCAIGCLIPDEQYSIDMEQKDVISIVNRYPSLPFVDVNLHLMLTLQRLHDGGVGFRFGAQMDMDDIKNRLHNIGIRFNLEIPESLNTPPIEAPTT